MRGFLQGYQPELDVYHNGCIRGKGKREDKLMAVPVNGTFLWGGQEIYIPAIYVGEAGAVLDVCTIISMEDMTAFLKKWDKKRRMSLKTQEEYEQITADNPGSREFTVEMSLDNIPLVRRVSSSLNWYPENVFRMGNESSAPARSDEWRNDPDAETLMDAYGCSREYCWHFVRLSYNWNGNPILSPQEIALSLQANPLPVTVGYFNTSPACNFETLQAVHPVTGQEYTLTLYECEQLRQSFAEIGKENVIYPEYFQTLSYRISPEIERSLFDIRDCADGDRPKMEDAGKKSEKSVGATAVFMAGKSNASDRRMASSSMHYEPVSEIRWRMVFYIKPKADMEITLPVQDLDSD